MRSPRPLPARTLILTLAGAPPLAAQSPSRHELRGPEVAIHNLAGTVQIEGGSGDAVQVEVVPGGADAGDLEAHADLRIRVPAGRALELHLAVGRVSAANVNGRLSIRAAAAPVTVTGGVGETCMCPPPRATSGSPISNPPT